jgi:hypothetical protein
LYTSDIGIGLDYDTFAKQEEIEALLQLGQLVCGLQTLTQGGNLICKQFMFFSPFSMSMMYLASLCFEQFTIFKPQTSRPANSELYVIGKGFKGYQDEQTKLITDQLFELLATWKEKSDGDRMKEYIVPIPDDVYLTMFHTLHRIYKRQMYYINQNIKAVSELYPLPAIFHHVRNHPFYKSEQERLQQWKHKFTIPFRIKGKPDL